MARLPALASVLAANDHRGAPHWDGIQRALQTAGLVETGRRGGGAPHQGPRAAANMLLAMLCGEAPSRVAELVQLLADAPARSSNWLALESDNSCEEFDEIARAETLGEAIEAFLCNALAIVTLGQQMALHRMPGLTDEAAFRAAAAGLVLNVRLQVIRPQCTARLALIDCMQEGGPRVIADVWFDAQSIPAMFRRSAGAGLVMAAEVGLDVVAALGHALRGRDDNRDKDREAVTPWPQPGSARGDARANTIAARVASIQGEQRRDAVQAANRVRASHE